VVRQVLPWQQPVHEAASQTHTSFLHSWPTPHAGPEPHVHVPAAEHWLDDPAAHVVQDAPFTPHSASETSSQVRPLQHPPHDVASQLQRPATHLCPAAHARPSPQVHCPTGEQVSAVMSQATHADPAAPQAASFMLVVHTEPTQQPLAQLVAQPEQAPALQVSSVGHLEHEPPAEPQAVARVPVWHVPSPSQHPLQVLASQTHAPFSHACPVAHAGPEPHWHVPPALHPSLVSPSQLGHAQVPSTHVRPGAQGNPVPHFAPTVA